MTRFTERLGGEVVNAITVICTGNAVRSVMAGALLEQRSPAGRIRIRTAGTLAVEGQPMSFRTRDALKAIRVLPPEHLSHQLEEADLVDATLVLAMADEHVQYVRRVHPEAAARTATIRRLCRDLAGPNGSLVTRLAALELATVELEAWENVADPAAGGMEDYLNCATELDRLVDDLLPRLLD
jgi:protein-tyrosine-phosphatase